MSQAQNSNNKILQQYNKDEQLKNILENLKARKGTQTFSHRQREEQAKSIETELKSHLDNIVKQVMNEKSTDISLLQRIYGQETHDVIRAAATNSYLIGTNYLGTRKQRLHHMFITESDVVRIKEKTAEFEHIFWRRVAAVLRQKQTVQNIMKSARFSTNSQLSITSLISGLATRIVTGMIALGTIIKAGIIGTGAQSDAQSSLPQYNGKEILVWRCQNDERTCQFCLSLDGMEWHSDDPNLLIPPDDSHELCRCRLDTVDTEYPPEEENDLS